MAKNCGDLKEKGLVLKFSGLDGQLYFHLDEGHFYNLRNKCADSQILLLHKSTDVISKCYAKPGVQHTHPLPSRSDVEISTVLWACKLRAIRNCNTEETIAQIITNVVAAWPNKLPISESEIDTKFSSSIQKYQCMAKGGSRCTRFFHDTNSEEIFYRFKEAILRPLSYWKDEIITPDPKNEVCQSLSLTPYEGRKMDEFLEKLNRIIEKTKTVRKNSTTIFSQSLHQFHDMVYKYRNLLMKIRIQWGARTSFKIANSILRPAYLDLWLKCKQSEIEIMQVINETSDVLLLTNKSYLPTKSREPILLLHVPSLDSWTKRASKQIVKKVIELQSKKLLRPERKTLNFVDESDMMEDQHAEVYKIWHMNQTQRDQVLNQITQLGNHCDRNRKHPSLNHVECCVIFMSGKAYKECWYSVYIESVLLKRRLRRIPGPPYEVQVCAMTAGDSSEINGPFFRLKWKKRSKPFPIKFLIQYRSKDSDSGTWNEKLTDESLERPYQQDFPHRGSAMEFRIAVETCFGRSDFSDIVDARPLSANEQMEPTEDNEIQKRKNGLDPESEEECVQFLENVPRPKKQKTVVLPPTQLDVGNLKNSLDSPAQDSSSEDDCIQIWSNVAQVEKQNTGLFPVIDLQVATVPENVCELKCTLVPLQFAANLAKQCDLISTTDGMNFYAVPLTKSTTANEMETFERFIFNPPGQHQVEETQMKTILLLGGNDPSCKVTFINALVNYVFNVRFEDNFRFQLLEKQAIGRTGIRVYEIRQAEGFSIPFSLTIIDIPNCEETKDLERDQKIVKMISTFLEVENGHGITELDLIGLIADASQPTLSSVEINFFNSVFSLFGKDIQENIRFLLTNADPADVPPILTAVRAAGFPCLEDLTTGKPLHHIFNHSNFIGANREEPTQDRTSNYWFKLHGSFCFKMGVKFFKDFFSALGLIKSKSLSMTRLVIQGRRLFESIKNDAQSLFMDGVIKKMEMMQNEKIIADCQTRIDALSEKPFEDVARQVALSHGMLVNNCSKCSFTCSNNFSRIKIETDDSFSKDLTHCHVCPGKCHWDVHSFSKSFKWEHAMELVFTEIETEECDAEIEKMRNALKVVDKLKKDLEENEKAVVNQRNLIADCNAKLNSISLCKIVL